MKSIKMNRRSLLTAVLAGTMMLNQGISVFAENVTPSEEETSEVTVDAVEETSEPTTETVLEDADNEPDETETGEVQYTAEIDGATVTATAATGVIPDGAVFTVSLIEDETVIEETAAQLDNSGVTYDGFAALDISFIDKDGNKIEPEEGTVKVGITLPAEDISESIDTSTIAVQHLAEAEDGTITVETVADTTENTDGTIAVTDTEVSTEFEVESFSTFTITWNDTGNSGGDSSDRYVTVHYVDDSGNELNVSATNITFNSSTTEVRLSDYAEEISGYTYLKATRSYSYSGYEITHVRANYHRRSFSLNSYWYLQYSSDGSSWTDASNGLDVYLVYVQDKTATIHYVDTAGNTLKDDTEISLAYNSETVDLSQYVTGITGYTYRGTYLNSRNGVSVNYLKVGSSSSYYETTYSLQYSSDNSTWTSTTDDADIYIVYKQDTVVADITPEHSKTVTDTDVEGVYNLTLSVTGDMSSTQEDAMLDVIVVLDVSGSMAYSMGNGNNNNRRKVANNAITTLVNSLANSSIDTRYSLVTFSGDNEWNEDPYDDAAVAQEWTSDVSDFTSSLPTSSNGGTNYEAGLYSARTLLNSTRSGATTCIIFVSDGDVTFYYNDDGSTGGTGSSDNQGTGMSHAQSLLSQLDVDYFYTVGVGPKSNYTKLSTELISGAKTLAQTNNTAFKDTITNSYAGTSSTALAEAFDAISGEITTYKFYNVSITDKLSDNVEITTNADGELTVLRVIVTKGDGTQVVNATGSATFTEPDGISKTIRAEYNSETREITLYFDPSQYALEDGWTYSVVAEIQPTDAAYNADTNIGDAGTGSYSGLEGVYTNDEATLTYTYNGQEKTLEYAMPVVPVKKAVVTVAKELSGNMANSTDEFTFTFKVLRGNNNFTGTVTSIKTSTDGTVTTDSLTYDSTTGLYSFTLKGGENVAVTVPVGFAVVVTETESNGYTTKVQIGSGSNNTSNVATISIVSEDVTVTFTNTNNVDVPTGLNNQYTPYIAVVLIALVGSAGYVILNRKRRKYE